MQMRYLPIAALAAIASAQDQAPSLIDLIGSTESLSQLGTVVNLVPGLADQLGGLTNVTILAPTNEAFEALGTDAPTDPEAIGALLLYHVIPGVYNSSQIQGTTFVPTSLNNTAYTNVTGGQVVQATAADGGVSFFSGLGKNSTVSQADVAFAGGVVHVIDSVLTLPESVSNTAIAAGLSSLAGALTQAELVETVDGLADVTIFAPSNEAFQAIGSALDGISNEDLASILTYHVVQGTVGYSTDLTDGQTLTTVNGEDLTINIEGENVFVNGASVVQANVLVAGGVVHVIDHVLNPAASAEPSAGATAGAPAFSGASSVSEAPFTSGVPEATQTLAPPPAATPTAGGEGAASTGAAVPMATGAVGAAALFGAAGAILMI